ncbi:hypothetical protein [Arsenicicoccus dermatophilus]|uniref:hypothetical protein n=1 Tax=Arsenicicoccus dermatophilus TaxID=1076331 RepID=UPI001F4CCEAD|nr:hypothetical protein [Arsenicicoccus dermatophilus]MCH8611575.1 hypothetical protein [Arsenicicoccus dermatophilus]
MDGEIQVISDGDGVLLLGDPATLDLFVERESLAARPLPTTSMRRATNVAGAAAEAAAVIAESSGRWVKLTEQSAKYAQAGALRVSKTSGNATGVIAGKDGQVATFVEFVRTPAGVVTNPAALAGIGGLMSQIALQQAMDEIGDYLAVIDAKVEDVLRAQKDTAVAELLGVGLVLDEALAVRESVGRVSDVTWSKVDQAPLVIASAQSYALRRLEALADKIEKESKVGDLATLMRHAESEAHEWLGVLARSFQLADAVAILELDRVLDSDADSVDAHRAGMTTARRRRLTAIDTATHSLLERIEAAATLANDRVLFNPLKAPAVVASANCASSAVAGLQETLGLAPAAREVEARSWKSAAGETHEHLVRTGRAKAQAARELGGLSLNGAKTAASDAAGRIRSLRHRRD